MQEDEKIEEYIIPEDPQNAEKTGWKGKLYDFLNSKYFVPITIVLIAIIAFCLGRISGLQEKREPVRVLNNSSPNPLLLQQEKGASEQTPSSVSLEQNAAVGASDITSGEVVVASKNGTKYHYPWCAGAKQIAEKNLVTFNSIEEARASGYTPAANCKGLK